MVDKKRKWWVAFLLTLFVGGSGYLYSGHSRRFFVFATIASTIFFMYAIVGFRLGINPLILLVVYAALKIMPYAMAIDSGIAANRQRNFISKWYNKWWIYILVGGVFIAATFVVTNKRFAAIKSYSIPSVSMAPALMVGDYLLADLYAYTNSQPARGDVVILSHTKNPKLDWLKRVIGLPGDEIQFINGQIYLNGKPLPQAARPNHLKTEDLKQAKMFLETLPSGRSYMTMSMVESKESGADNTKVFHVPSGHYFVVGDNRDNSADSRFLSNLGFIPQKNIYAKAKIIYWSSDLSRIGTLPN